jgi:sugar phosphate isomerase/epimerase
MKFGICTSTANAAAAKDAGWDYLEEAATGLLQGFLPDEEWTGGARAAGSPVPVIAVNLLIPASLRLTGPTVDLNALRTYLTRVFDRAVKVGVSKLAFAGGAARTVPAGFDHWEARDQLVECLRLTGDLAGSRGLTIALEPLRSQECNLVNTMLEVLAVVREVDRPSVACLFDSFHVWSAQESLENLKEAAPRVRHIHVADLEGRVAPGESGTSDYRPAFGTLKRDGYDETISVEASGFDVASAGRRVLDFLKRQWNEC